MREMLGPPGVKLGHCASGLGIRKHATHLNTCLAIMLHPDWHPLALLRPACHRAWSLRCPLHQKEERAVAVPQVDCMRAEFNDIPAEQAEQADSEIAMTALYR